MRECENVRPDFDTDDVPDDATVDQLREEMELRRSDLFVWEDEPMQVVSTDGRMSPFDRDSMDITDPTGQTGSWGVPLVELYAAWKRGEAHPGHIEMGPGPADEHRVRVDLVLASAPDTETARRQAENLLDGAIEQGYIEDWEVVEA